MELLQKPINSKEQFIKWVNDKWNEMGCRCSYFTENNKCTDTEYIISVEGTQDTVKLRLWKYHNVITYKSSKAGYMKK